ncbi:MAG: hypothetical protein IKD80_04285 [Selenomonadaceae bacterium]|nr:hypothetical protein [Selenomonadaceae bacterium]
MVTRKIIAAIFTADGSLRIGCGGENRLRRILGGGRCCKRSRRRESVAADFGRRRLSQTSTAARIGHLQNNLIFP